MTDMSDKELDMMLGAHEVPEPSELLKARIIKATKNTQTPKPSFAKRYMAVAASALAICAIGMTSLQLTIPSETQIWQEAASDLGFDEIYEWVESEDTPTQ